MRFFTTSIIGWLCLYPLLVYFIKLLFMIFKFFFILVEYVVTGLHQHLTGLLSFAAQFAIVCELQKLLADVPKFVTELFEDFKSFHFRFDSNIFTSIMDINAILRVLG